MGIPEQRLKGEGDFDMKMEVGQQAINRKPTTSGMSDADFTKTESGSPISTMSRSPLSSISNTDSDDSVEVRVRSPMHPKYRKCPRETASLRPAAASASDCASVKTESESSDGERSSTSTKRPTVDGFVVPKKRFRRDYEAAVRLEEKSNASSDGECCEASEATRDVAPHQPPVAGCPLHRQVVFECHACMEVIAKRFGWPVHALRVSPTTPVPAVPLVPRYGLPFAPFVDPLLAYQALSADRRLAQAFGASAAAAAAAVADPRLLLGAGTASRRSSTTPVVSTPPTAPEESAVPQRSIKASPAADSVEPQEDAPLDLTRRSGVGRGGGASNSGGRFSIENILAGKTASAAENESTCPATVSSSAAIRTRPSASSSSSSVSDKFRTVNSSSSTISAAAISRHHGRSAPPLPPPISSSASASSSSVCVDVSGGSSSSGGSAGIGGCGDRRELANERERMRVKHLTGAFKELSASVGGIAAECIGTSGLKFTKVAILRTASLYIGYLSHVLSDGPGATEEKVYDQMRAAILEVMTAKSKKGKDDDDEDDDGVGY